ncbi:uncharacterized protein LOC133219470 [Neopsephotus bourkii]|uniref:uncharacterized protein LOC133219470 n=1 Tax=Neopsephotus bourkii TaxID=309878 RepID=UPI002AA55D8F|nr:uncharacterized protein LOC133219470 [Neopsephotus bourkii]
MLACIQSVFYLQPLRLVPRVKQSWAWALSRVRRPYRRTKKFSARLGSHEWQGVWDNMGKHLGQWAPPVLWNFTTEQVQNPEKLVKHLNEECCHSGYTREGQIMATCWGLTYGYRALFNTIQHLQEEKNVPESEGKATVSAATPAASTEATPATATTATPTPVTITVATQTLTTDTAATPTTVIITAAKPEDQFVPISVAPLHRGKSKKKRQERQRNKMKKQWQGTCYPGQHLIRSHHHMNKKNKKR